MSSLKSDLNQLCKDVAVGFDGWSFASDMFKNKSLKHTDLIVWPAFFIRGGGDNRYCSVQPSACVVNKKTIKLYSDIFGVKPYWTSIIKFQTIRNELKFYPVDMRVVGSIWQYRQKLVDAVGKEMPWPTGWITLDEARPVLTSMMQDGVALFEKYYDLSSERALLANLPIDPEVVWPNGIEKISGVMLCIAKILIGDFDFILHYRSDEFKTQYPKHYKELDAIIAVLPELKRRFGETGSVLK